jgi:DNA polymerase elongation subunit (family B)
MRILTLDIETSPILGTSWKTWNTNIIKVHRPTRMLSFAAKWEGDRKVHFFSEYHDGAEAMVQEAHAFLDQADVVVHFNGQSFDVPHLNREMALLGLRRPSGYVQLDLLLNARKLFRFDQNRLKDLTAAFGLEGKAQHEGYGLWEKCLDGDAAAWKMMRRYNKQDVVATEGLYLHLRDLGWIAGHPNRNLYDDTVGCPICGGEHLQKRGFAYTKVSKYQQYQCVDCGHYFRGTKRLSGVSVQQVAS